MLAAAAVAVLFTWMFIALLLVGFGSLALRRFDTDFLLLDAFWLGLAVSVALLETWSLFRPVNPATAILLCCISAGGLIENRALIFGRLKAAFQSAPRLILVCSALALFLAVRASGPCDHTDTGLYGAPAVRWIQTYPVVPGLANVHGRLGFNSSVFLFIAALSQGVWHGLGFHLFTGFVIGAICFTLFPACVRLARASSASPADWFYSILAIPVVFWIARAPIVGTQTDQPATIVCLVAAGILFEEFCRKASKGDRKPNYARLVTAACLFALAVTFKETTILFALLAWCVAFLLICSNLPSAKRRVGFVLTLSALLILPWCVRGIILSGYPFFPATVFGFPVDWRTPVTVTNWYDAGAVSWARMPDVELADTRGIAWLRPWLDHAIRDRASFQVPLFIALSGLVIAAALRFRRTTSSAYPWLWLLLPSLSGAVFWFFVCPALRFGQVPIWVSAATLGAWAIVSFTCGSRQLNRPILAALSLLLIWCLISFGWKPLYTRLLATPPLALLPQPRLTVRQTLSGLAVYVPLEGSNCWDTPLPCTPYFDETLRLRDPRSMRFGFSSESQGKQLPRFSVSSTSKPSNTRTVSLILSPCPSPTSKSPASGITGTHALATSGTPPLPSAPGNISTR